MQRLHRTDTREGVSMKLQENFADFETLTVSLNDQVRMLGFHYSSDIIHARTAWDLHQQRS